MKKLIILFIFLQSFVSLAQFSTDDATRLFENQSELGIGFGILGHNWSETAVRTATALADDYSTSMFALDFNFAQTGKFNFRTGLQFDRQNVATYLYVLRSEFDGERDLRFREKSANTRLSIPLNVEFVNQVSNKLYYAVNAGISVSYLDIGQNKDVAINLPNGGFVDVQRSEDLLVNLGYQFGASIYLRTNNGGLFRFSIQILSYAESDRTRYNFTGTNNLDFIQLTTNYSGRSTLFSLHWSPPKSWFKKK